MQVPDDLDVRLDGLALIEAAHRDDFEGAGVLLDNCDARSVAVFLARVASDLVEGLCESPAEALAYLRARHAEGCD
jgi:hypothetical protein